MSENAFSLDDDDAWAELRALWQFRPGECYLNHGSFGPSPRPVREAQRRWMERLESNPMDFFLRESPPALARARQRLAEFIGARSEDSIFVDNATMGMNIVAASVRLGPGDEVLLNDHEYGAVLRLWERVCARTGARVVVSPLRVPIGSAEEVVADILAGVTARTRLVVFSHITSPTAVVLPAGLLCRRARELGIATCIDGPHAVATLPLDLAGLDCDFYTASCHKWLSAPFGSGFLYVHPRWQEAARPVVVSWGRTPPGESASWRDEFGWLGTRDPSPWLGVPQAIDFLETIGIERFRQRIHALARYARARIVALTGREALVHDSPAWYGGMIALPLPDGQAEPLQRLLWEEHGIEIPVVDWQGRRLLRPSCHLYTTRADIDRLVEVLPDCLERVDRGG